MKKKLLTKLMALTIVGATLGASGVATNTASAKEYTGNFDQQQVETIARVFDAEYYAASYPDVVAAFGNDENMLLKHYLLCGIYEGRDASATFNADAYWTLNPDVAAAVDKAYASCDQESQKTQSAKYFNEIYHYVTMGVNENRKSSLADVKNATVISPTNSTATTGTTTTGTTSSASSNKAYSTSTGSVASSSAASSSTATSSANKNYGYVDWTKCNQDTYQQYFDTSANPENNWDNYYQYLDPSYADKQKTGEGSSAEPWEF